MTIASLRDTDPRHLAALVAVYEHGTFAHAAEALGFTQSAISQQIAQLERSAGIAVFDRPKGPRPAELTAAGHVLLDFARRTLARLDEMDQRLDLMRRGLTGRLTVGTFQSASAELLPNIIGRMRRDVPEVEVRLDETDDQDELVHDILTDETDLAFTVDLDEDSRLLIDLLGHDPFVVIAPSGEVTSPITTAAEIDAHPLIGQPDTLTGQRMIDDRLIGAGVRPEFEFRFQNNAAVQSMVRSGLGWAVMPSLAIDADDPGITVMQTDPPLPPRAIQLISRAGRTLLPVADRFRTISLDVSTELLER